MDNCYIINYIFEKRLYVAVLYRLTCIYEYYNYGIIKDILE